METDEKKLTFFITTAIDYTTAAPHVGHAYEKIAADILARYWRKKERKVYFLTGTDEHGLKNFQAAEKEGKEPQVFVDEMAKKYQAAWKDLEISYDHFVRTTEPDHEKKVQEFLQKLYEKEDIYQGKYEGLYCLACEEYKVQRELLDGNLCPIHKIECQKLTEEVYFFKLSKYQNEIIDLLESDRLIVLPNSRKNEILSFLKQPLQDLAISRSKVSWGIKLPWACPPCESARRSGRDSKQTIYVWVDALLNYFTASFGNWPPTLQLIGGEISRFHTVIWPALLIAAGEKLPEKIFIHGMLTVDGEKMSKTQGNVIDPSKLVEEFGADGVRYFLFREVPFGQDGDFSILRLRERYEKDLANDLGNLLQRTIVMANKYQVDWKYRAIQKEEKDIDEAIERLDFSRALDLIWAKINAANQKIDTEKPWALIKTEPTRLQQVISELLDQLVIISELIYPFMPKTNQSMINQLKSLEPAPIFPKL